MSPHELPALPRDTQGPVFRAPWEAHAFALVVALHERGLIEWTDWAARLGAAIARAQAAGDPDLGDTYYRHWLDALEQLLVDKGLAQPDAIHRLEHAWADAAQRTPHGKPIELSEEERVLARR